ncbi:MAG TPA: hypothetical protein DCE42_20345 [Myxococcales bacterium]|nr:hypothetical protein [Deltaproteobacteria bacterium]MBU48911.1 hypothetical protein [Deltaproteobacteria bacterium]HAA57127.1 hypothetical protein [Myxococcales bacterium]|tara:strand:- start:1620 stop:3215 length:1596 start_codon:yes stop_codon:yes gene_type:complete
MTSAPAIPRFLLVTIIVCVLFGVTPFLHCGGGEPLERAHQDAGSLSEPSGTDRDVSADTSSTIPDGPSPNTVYVPPGNTNTPGDFFFVKLSDFTLEPSGEKRICLIIDAPLTENRLLNRFEPVIEQDGMISQMTLSVEEKDTQAAWDCSDEESTDAKHLFVWLKGLPAFQFPANSGVLLEGKKRLRLTLRVHNTTQAAVQVTGGVKVFHLASGGKEYKLWSRALQDKIELAPGASATKTDICVLKHSVEFLAGVPMLGAQGTRFIGEFIREDAPREEWIFMEDWTPAVQKVYAFPHKISKGDTLALTCAWRNRSTETVQGGWKSSDEQCGLLAYIHVDDSLKDGLCGEKSETVYKPPPIEYTPGECASKDGLSSANNVPITTTLASELDVDFGFQGGEWVAANWELIGGEVIFNHPTIGNLLMKEHTIAVGQIRTGETVYIDIVLQAMMAIGARKVKYALPISASGAFKKGQKAGVFEVDVKCGTFNHQKMTYSIKDGLYGTTLSIGGIISTTTQIGPLEYAIKLIFRKKL